MRKVITFRILKRGKYLLFFGLEFNSNSEKLLELIYMLMYMCYRRLYSNIVKYIKCTICIYRGKTMRRNFSAHSTGIEGKASRLRRFHVGQIDKQTDGRTYKLTYYSLDHKLRFFCLFLVCVYGEQGVFFNSAESPPNRYENANFV